ncbi:unnamed protein product, partial [Medioppia subpectinata]
RLEAAHPYGHLRWLNALKSPRILASNLPLALMPDSVKTPVCKIIYVLRNPKDQSVSYYYQHRVKGILSSFDDFISLYMCGHLLYGDYFSHVIDYWRLSRMCPHNVFVLTFEELKLETQPMAKLMADFLGLPHSRQMDELIRQRLDRHSLSLCCDSTEAVKRLAKFGRILVDTSPPKPAATDFQTKSNGNAMKGNGVADNTGADTTGVDSDIKKRPKLAKEEFILLRNKSWIPIDVYSIESESESTGCWTRMCAGGEGFVNWWYRCCCCPCFVFIINTMLNNKITIIFLGVLIVTISESMAQKDQSINIDLGKIFRLGLNTGKGGTKLGIDVLNGLVNVGVDRTKYNSVDTNSGYNNYDHINADDNDHIRPVIRPGLLRERIRNRIINHRKGATEVAVSIGNLVNVPINKTNALLFNRTNSPFNPLFDRTALHDGLITWGGGPKLGFTIVNGMIDWDKKYAEGIGDETDVEFSVELRRRLSPRHWIKKLWKRFIHYIQQLITAFDYS